MSVKAVMSVKSHYHIFSRLRPRCRLKTTDITDIFPKHT
jgi:hypothetical protein